MLILFLHLLFFMKKSSKSRKSLFLALLFVSLPAIIFFQNKSFYSNEDVVEIQGDFERLRLKQHRIYKVQLKLKNDPNNYVLDHTIYPAWEKFGFRKQVKFGHEISMTIAAKDKSKLGNQEEDLIHILAMKDQSQNYLKLEETNLYRKLSFIKFYIFWGIALMIYLYMTFYKAPELTDPS